MGIDFPFLAHITDLSLFYLVVWKFVPKIVLIKSNILDQKVNRAKVKPHCLNPCYSRIPCIKQLMTNNYSITHHQQSISTRIPQAISRKTPMHLDFHLHHLFFPFQKGKTYSVPGTNDHQRKRRLLSRCQFCTLDLFIVIVKFILFIPTQPVFTYMIKWLAAGRTSCAHGKVLKNP